MDQDLERVLQMLREAQTFAAGYRFQMTDEYLELIDRVEALAANQSGAEKSGRRLGRRWRALAAGK